MSDFVRVLDKDTGHKRSVPESELPHGNYAVIDEPAVHQNTGLPLPPVYGTPKSLSSKSNSGQLAEPKKENKHG